MSYGAMTDPQNTEQEYLYNGGESGTEFIYREDAVLINGVAFKPIEVIEAAQGWVKTARRREWPLRCLRGLEIDTEKFYKRVAAAFTGTRE